MEKLIIFMGLEKKNLAMNLACFRGVLGLESTMMFITFDCAVFRKDGQVSALKFSQILKWFGPMQKQEEEPSFLDRLRVILQTP
jgi:hypothetical protein